MRNLLWVNLLAGALFVSGCGDKAATAEEREERDPHVQSGQRLVEEGRYSEAVAVFHEAIENEPSMARPHLDMAMAYQRMISQSLEAGGGDLNQIVDYHTRAIYHYDRYLQLRPDAEKSEFIQEQKTKLIESLAVYLINRSPVVRQVVQERDQLKRERVELKRQLATALSSQKTATPAAKPTAAESQSVTRAVPKSTTPPSSAPTTKHQIHHVVAGDTLTKIANKFYQDSGKWDVIFEANKDSLKSPGDLKVGQTLVIPAAGD